MCFTAPFVYGAIKSVPILANDGSARASNSIGFFVLAAGEEEGEGGVVEVEPSEEAGPRPPAPTNSNTSNNSGVYLAARGFDACPAAAPGANKCLCNPPTTLPTAKQNILAANPEKLRRKFQPTLRLEKVSTRCETSKFALVHADPTPPPFPEGLSSYCYCSATTCSCVRNPARRMHN